jgi:hypothetical protein
MMALMKLGLFYKYRTKKIQILERIHAEQAKKMEKIEKKKRLEKLEEFPTNTFLLQYTVKKKEMRTKNCESIG